MLRLDDSFTRSVNSLLKGIFWRILLKNLFISGNPMPNITWLKNGGPPERQLGVFQYKQRSVVLEDLVPNDSGNYTCVVCNLLGCINFTSKVDVIGKNFCICLLLETFRTTSSIYIFFKVLYFL